MAFDNKKLVCLMKRNGVSRYRLMYDTLINRSVIYRLVTGEKKNPRFETVEILADYFKVNMETFCRKTKEF